jgi:hypothetical protein
MHPAAPNSVPAGVGEGRAGMGGPPLGSLQAQRRRHGCRVYRALRPPIISSSSTTNSHVTSVRIASFT